MKILITESQYLNLLKENKFETIFNDYYQKMLNTVCMKYTKDLDKAQDFCQNGFIKVYQNLNKYDETGSLEGWVRRVINNSILDELRKKKMDFVDGEDGFDFSRYDSGEEDYKEDDDELSMDDVMIGLEKLSPTYKKIFKMFYLDGLSHEEISKKLGISVGTSKSNLFKAKANIKKYLK
jgi:RNA polymerase sigma factor (sigma-70 family)